ncbi:Glu/Leu/Phe/Val dehydrogenase dimerization domain-containing protein [Gracilibacillus sp. S3-1-1]|uniref:Glu/Leu/Phe/Val dehydrogenase dimerization domain-containing protein n=1 Tax=Gracilibacillus pellucidus TaxID=3095368 RepID=A0ACC6M6P8_9BACI|nr:Glu/Leu/Phe/Val dehydrogenase dimerization domain-containing protein [Gracilibacillus sp. S3-1-1]MDX8046492.1 Glu/Leu/Phe/Val dehydrogenase dimerization domain-containing protein [Gracilibacillus sp. S3-1-1]
MIFDKLAQYDYEQLVFCQDEETGLKAIIAIHDTTLGPSLGGLRIWPYQSDEEAIIDVLRLSRGMTYKSAISDLNLGGGKAVIIGDPKEIKSEELFRTFGRFIEGLNGRYITGEDVGSTVEDMETIRKETKYATGVSPELGGCGNPSPFTAHGVYKGIKSAALKAFGTDDLTGKTIAVQGVGNVAYNLCRKLHEDGANLVVSDINKDNVQKAVTEFGATEVDVDAIYDVDCDIFAPCAMGASINDDTIARLKAKVVAGAANNQLKDARHGELLQEKGIVYAPDYVVNAGGIIAIEDALHGFEHERAMEKIDAIYDKVQQIFEYAEKENVATNIAADRLAEERIRKAKEA